MGLRNTDAEFGSLAKWLHWLVAIGIALLLFLGLLQAGMERGPEKTELRALHASIALIVLVLMTLRLLWRLANRVPAHPQGIPGWQKAMATIVHWAIYAAVFVQLVSGPMTIATNGSPVSFFGLFGITLPVEKNEDSHHIWEEIHEFSWKIIVGLLIVHVVGALYNHFVLRNDVLRRMTVGSGS